MKLWLTQNAAEGKREMVTFIKWFNSARTWATVIRANGSRVQVPGLLLSVVR